jgi:hypothetical protein
MPANLQGVEPSGEEGVFEALAKKRAEPQAEQLIQPLALLAPPGKTLLP